MSDKSVKHDHKTEEKPEATRNEIEILNNKCGELENKYKRALADYVNLQKRTDEEREKFVKFANEILLRKVLEILDDLEQSQKHIKDDGLNKVIERFRKFLTDNGVEEIESEGKEFDPSLHEAIESVEGDENKIIKVHRKGYKFFSKPLRIAMVAVGSGKK
jgi:molecular chaperone GrpE